MKTKKFLNKCSKCISYLKSKFSESLDTTPPISARAGGLEDVFSMLTESDKTELRIHVSDDLSLLVMTGKGTDNDD